MPHRELSLKGYTFGTGEPTHSERRRVSGFSRVELLVITGITLLAFFLILPAFHKTHSHPGWSRCINNLKQIALAEIINITDAESEKPSWATSKSLGGSLEYRESPEVWRHFQVISNELIIPKVLHCRTDKEREPAADWQKLANSNLSYFVNLDAGWSTNQEIASSTMFFGDRLLEIDRPQPGHLLRITARNTVSWKTNIHEQQGCVAFADGSVERLTTSELQKLISTGELHGTKRGNPPALLAVP